MIITDIAPDPERPVVSIQLSRKEAAELLARLRRSAGGETYLLNLLIHLQEMDRLGKI